MQTITKSIVKAGTQFQNPENLVPVTIMDANNIKESELEQLIDRYYRTGFALFQYNHDINGEHAIYTVSKMLNLGDPFVANVYKEKLPTLYADKQITTITKAESTHKAFNTDNEQRLHTDGTFTELGTVKTTVLYCVENAAKGGDTILFDSVNAYNLLVQHDIDAATALLHKESLRRVADIGFDAEQIGPTFAINGEDITTRFTIDNTADWDYGISRVQHLDRAYNYLCNLAISGSEYFLQFNLLKGQGIIMANDKISHGRTKFENADGKVRIMTRGVYCNRPTLL